MSTQKQTSSSQEHSYQNHVTINIGWTIVSIMLILMIFAQWKFDWVCWLGAVLLAICGQTLDMQWSIGSCQETKQQRNEQTIRSEECLKLLERKDVSPDIRLYNFLQV